MQTHKAKSTKCQTTKSIPQKNKTDIYISSNPQKMSCWCHFGLNPPKRDPLKMISHPNNCCPRNRATATRFKTCIGSEALRTGLCLASRLRHDFPTPKKGVLNVDVTLKPLGESDFFRDWAGLLVCFCFYVCVVAFVLTFEGGLC